MNRKKVGYDWEAELVNIFSSGSWRAIRLGSPSVHLPDVVAINNDLSALIAIEAKSSSGGVVKVKPEQLNRLLEFLELFKAYRVRIPVLAVRFMRGRGRGRELKFYIVKGKSQRWILIKRGGEAPDALINTTLEYLLKAGVER